MMMIVMSFSFQRSLFPVQCFIVLQLFLHLAIQSMSVKIQIKTNSLWVGFGQKCSTFVVFLLRDFCKRVIQWHHLSDINNAGSQWQCGNVSKLRSKSCTLEAKLLLVGTLISKVALSLYFKDCTPTCTLRSSDTNLLCVPHVRTCFGSRGFSVAAPTIWNSLPLDIRNSWLIASFRRQLKTFLFLTSGHL